MSSKDGRSRTEVNRIEEVRGVKESRGIMLSGQKNGFSELREEESEEIEIREMVLGRENGSIELR